jgi:hypothetical protein
VGGELLKKLSFAQIKMKNFIGNRLTGAKTTKTQHEERALIISTAIYSRFGVHVYQYQQKHLIWFLVEYSKGYTKGTRYNYYLTIMKIITLTPKFSCWKEKIKHHSLL